MNCDHVNNTNVKTSINFFLFGHSESSIVHKEGTQLNKEFPDQDWLWIGT